MTTLLLASTATLAGALVLAGSPPATDCRPVEGTIAARVTDVGMSLRGLRASAAGTSAGDLRGPVALEATRGLGADGFELVLRVRTADGELRLAGRATTSEGGADDARLLSGRLAVDGGTGGYARAGGALVARGRADVSARSATVEYSGSLCGAGAAGRS